MSVNSDEDKDSQVYLLFDDTKDPKTLPAVVGLPSYKDDEVRTEIEKEHMSIYKEISLDDEEEEIKESITIAEDPRGILTEYMHQEQLKREEIDKMLYYDNRYYKKMKKMKAPPYRAWTERELRSVPLTLVERHKAPYFHCCTMFFDGILYPPYALYYVLRYFLWRFVIVDLILLLILLLGVLALVYLLAWWIAKTIFHVKFSTSEGQQLIFVFFELFLYFLLLTADSVSWLNPVNFWMNWTKKKLSNITEQLMKGTKAKNVFCYSITRGERSGGGLGYYVGVAFDYLTVFGVRFVLFTLLVPFVVSIFQDIGTPAIGTSINICVTVLIFFFNYALGSFTIVLNRKKFRYGERVLFCLRYLPMIMGYGCSVFVLMMIPGLNIYYSFFCDYIAGTRCYLHLEYRCGPHKLYFDEVPRIVYQTTVLKQGEDPVIIQQAGEVPKNIIVTEKVVKNAIKEKILDRMQDGEKLEDMIDNGDLAFLNPSDIGNRSEIKIDGIGDEPIIYEDFKDFSQIRDEDLQKPLIEEKDDRFLEENIIEEL